MKNVRVARRYAEAFVELTEGRKEIEGATKDLELLRQSIEGSREFRLFLRSPIIAKTKKSEILRGMFTGKVQNSTAEFLEMLIDKGREELLPDIIDQVSAIRDERGGIINVVVKTATDFSKDQTASLQNTLESFTQKKVRISFNLEKQLKGGFVARVGDTVFDGSIKRQLELLRERFAEGGSTN
jgi:F-type H+-transporting ATPase subunit delta